MFACFSAMSILRLYGLTPSDLFFKWEAFLLSSSTSSSTKRELLDFSLDNLRELKKEIQSSANHESSHIKKENGTPAASVGASRIKKLGGRSALDGMYVKQLTIYKKFVSHGVIAML